MLKAVLPMLVCLEIVQNQLFVLSRSYWKYIGDCHKNFPVSQYLYDESCLYVRIFMIMASTGRRQLEAVLVEKPMWKHGNIGYIDPDEPLMMINGRQHYLIK